MRVCLAYPGGGALEKATTTSVAAGVRHGTADVIAVPAEVSDRVAV